MTVCIGAICQEGRTTVAVTDHMITAGDFSGDSLAVKDQPFLMDWTILTAGDVTHVAWILDRASGLTKQRKASHAHDVAECVSDAITQRLRMEIEKQVFSAHGFTFQSFHRAAKAKLTPEVFNRLYLKAENISLGCQLLVLGFDVDGQAHIFEVRERSAPRCYDTTGFWAIGSGQHAALSTLFFHAHKTGLDFMASRSRCIYHLLEAKFMSESARTVGERTMLSVRQRGKGPQFLSQESIAKIRAIWKRSGAPRVPLSALYETKKLDPVFVTGVMLEVDQEDET